LPILSREARYAYDETNIMMTGGGNGPYYLIRPRSGVSEGYFFLLAVLHHSQFIEHLPIPAAAPRQREAIETLVGQLLDVNDHATAARIPHQRQLHERNAVALREQIERQVNVLFGLSNEDMALIKAVPVPA